jgi:hypothetical protein
MLSKIKIKTAALLTAVAETIARSLTLPTSLLALRSLASRASLVSSLMPLLESSMMTLTLMEASLATSHHILHVDVEPSRKPKTSWEAKPSWKPEPSSSRKSMSLLLLKLLRIFSPGLIIDPPPLWILQQFISIDDLLEFLFGPRVLLVSVRMVLSRSPLERMPNVLLVGVLAYPQHLVRVGWLLGLADH